MNTAAYQKKKLTFESTRKKVVSVGTTAISYIVFMNTSSGDRDATPDNIVKTGDRDATPVVIV